MFSSQDHGVQSTTEESSFESSQMVLPKGGGSVRGISELFEVNAVTGTSSFSVPLPVSGGRGFEPELSLSYDSGAGNGAFGLGWSVGVPSIGRKTDKGLPQYLDAEESDVYTMAGVEDLIPLLMEGGGEWSEQVDEKSLGGVLWEVRYYRPRIESSYAKIERWRDVVSGKIWWRVTSGTNVTSVYGYREAARVADPSDSRRVFTWLLDCRFDDKGHYVQYDYKAEDLAGVDFGLSYEAHRVLEVVQPQRYLKRVLYGVKDSWVKQGLSVEGVITREFKPEEFHFQTVFDYGEHVGEFPVVNETAEWSCRGDAFSDYRAGFEIRTWRLCQRVLLFHQFENELPTVSELVKSVSFNYDDESGVCLLSGVEVRGFKRGLDGGIVSKSLPEMMFKYQEHIWNTELKSVDAESVSDLPMGVDHTQYKWVDLYSEGLSGVLSEQAGSLFYKSNLGDGKLSKAEPLGLLPSFSGLASGGLQVRDLEGNGVKQLVASHEEGYFTVDEGSEWGMFENFTQIPNIDWNDANLRVLDLTGDGKADLLISEERVFRWYRSEGVDGYDEARVTAKSEDEESGAALVFSNESETIFLTDMSGDGLQDIVRIRNGSVVYWPNLGYGGFGSKVTMANVPLFDHPDQFNPQLIQLADLDGSGPTDLVYLGKGEFSYWLNMHGNHFEKGGVVVNPFPKIDPLTNVSVMDLLGHGTACIVWSSMAPSDDGENLRYIDLMGGKKPHLMKGYENGMGKEVSLSYTPSTHFYLADKAKGEPWVTKLHFPVHCLSKVETVDHITGARFASSYSYHHGYYDHQDREFRGFGRVDQVDTEEYEHFIKGESSNVVESVFHQSPVLTKTWFHTGAVLDREKVLSQYEHEYFQSDALNTYRLAEPSLPTNLTDSEWSEALRACKGTKLRTEVYGLDGSDLAVYPYSMAESSVSILAVQPQVNQRHACFQVIGSENITMQLDRNPEDPRVSHQRVLKTDDYGQPLVSAAIGYGRLKVDRSLPSDIQELQNKTHIVITKTEFTEDEFGLLGGFDLDGTLDGTYRHPVAWRSETYELDSSGDNLLRGFESAESIAYHETLREETRRLLSSSETRFANGALDGELPAGKANALGIDWQSYQLAFIPELLSSVYGDRVDTASHVGGYVDLHNDGNWWVPSGTTIFGESASERFYLPEGTRDAMGTPSWVDMDDYHLLAIGSRDVKGNESIAVNDYHFLSAKYQRDSNDNWSGVELDALGQVVASAVMGKVDGMPTPDSVCEGDNLENPSAVFEYDLHTWNRDRKPTYGKSTTWAEHYFTNQTREKTHIQYQYSDGSGNAFMTKAQATPGVAKQLQPDGSVIEVDTGNELRWVGNGRTVLNNKGNPVKQYEPYFSVTSEYEDAASLVETGISPILFYDAVGRNECKLNPNHTYEKTVTSPWQSSQWDSHDTLYLKDEDNSIETNPAYDPHVGHYLESLSESEYLPTWYEARISGGLGAEEQRAVELTANHVATPAQVFTDSLGRSIYGLSDNGSHGVYKAFTNLDIEGNTLSVVDDRENTVMSYRYNLLPSPDEETPKPNLYQNSMEGGEKWVLFNVLGQPIKSWDSREHLFEFEYDELNRLTKSWVTENGVRNLVSLSQYEDSDADNVDELRSKNLIGAVCKSFDQAGRIQNLANDFKGNSLHVSRTVTKNYKSTINWDVANPQSLLEDEIFESKTEYDGLNRAVLAKSPHHSDLPASTTRPTYNESGGLDQMFVSIRGGEETLHIESIQYDAKGQRQEVIYGNGVKTSYSYEPDTYRLKNLTTKRGTTVLQDLNYTYDPIGNITEIRDHAQQNVFFNNTHIEANSTYEYDPLYRLTRSTGREHTTQAAFPHPDAGWAPESQKSDGQALQRYTQSYEYDGVGNILKMAHQPNGGSAWTRHYQYAEDSNRLAATTHQDPSKPFDQKYSYNPHGSMTSMPHLKTMDWNYSEQLTHVDLQGGGNAYYVYGASGQRTRKIIETNGSLTKERIYLGGWEIYRERNASGLQLERETLHVSDDQNRIALIETKTSDPSSVAEAKPLIRYQMSNHLGSSSLELSEAGEVISYEEFHPYGTTAYHAASNKLEASRKRYRYTGKERDEETGFSYHSARYLAPWLGRWCSTDPIGIGDGLNIYAYVSNNPVNLYDPSGLGGDSPPVFMNYDDVEKGVQVSDDPMSAIPNPYLWLKSRLVYYIAEPAVHAGETAVSETLVFAATNTIADEQGYVDAQVIYYNFIYGVGPEYYHFGDGSIQADEMRDSLGVHQMMDYFYIKFEGREPESLLALEDFDNSLVDYGFSFSPKLPSLDDNWDFNLGQTTLAHVDGLPYGTRIMMGAWSGKVVPVGDGENLKVTLDNTMSLTSYALHMLPSHDRVSNERTPWGNVDIRISFIIPIDKERLKGE